MIGEKRAVFIFIVLNLIFSSVVFAQGGGSEITPAQTGIATSDREIIGIKSAINKQEMEAGIGRIMEIYPRDYTDDVSVAIGSVSSTPQFVSRFIGENERINVHIDQFVGRDEVVGVVLENNEIKEIDQIVIDDNTLNIYTDELTIEQIGFSDAPVQEFLNAYRSGNIKIEGVGFGSKLKLGFSKTIFSVGTFFKGLFVKEEEPTISEKLSKITEEPPSKAKLVKLIKLLEEKSNQTNGLIDFDDPIAKEIKKTIDELIEKNKEDIANADEEKMDEILQEKIELGEFMLIGFVDRDFEDFQDLINRWIERMIELNKEKLKNAHSEEELFKLLEEKVELWEFTMSGLVGSGYDEQVMEMKQQILGKIIELNKNKIEAADSREELEALLKEKEELKEIACDVFFGNDELCETAESQLENIRNKISSL